jgi:hypothetical protein
MYNCINRLGGVEGEISSRPSPHLRQGSSGVSLASSVLLASKEIRKEKKGGKEKKARDADNQVRIHRHLPPSLSSQSTRFTTIDRGVCSWAGREARSARPLCG